MLKTKVPLALQQMTLDKAAGRKIGYNIDPTGHNNISHFFGGSNNLLISDKVRPLVKSTLQYKEGSTGSPSRGDQSVMKQTQNSGYPKSKMSASVSHRDLKSEKTKGSQVKINTFDFLQI